MKIDLRKGIAKDVPVVEQYKKIKEQYPECIIFFRIGEFYEIFYEDAHVVSKLLGLVISYKTKQKVAMCGFPKSALEIYIYRIMAHGYKVGVCDEFIEPSSNSLFRKIKRIFTRGTLIEADYLDNNGNNFLLAYIESGNAYALCDISTGELYVGSSIFSLEMLLTIWDPVECLVDKNLFGSKIWDLVTPWHARFNLIELSDKQKYYQYSYEVFNSTDLNPFNINEIKAIGIIIDYIKYTHNEGIRTLKPPQRTNYVDLVHMDPFTVQNLEIFQTLQGEFPNSLYGILRGTKTGVGHRLLRKRFQNPVRSLEIIKDRLTGIEYFTKNRLSIHKLLAEYPDLERIVGRIGFRQSNLKDINGVIKALEVCAEVHNALSGRNISYEVDNAVTVINSQKHLLDKLHDIFELTEDSSLEVGNFIKSGYNKQLDDLRAHQALCMKSIDGIIDRYKREHNLGSVNLKFAKNFGFYLDVPKSRAMAIPYSFRRVQDLSNSFRYITDEMDLVSQEFMKTVGEILVLEQNLLRECAESIIAVQEDLYEITQSLGTIDIAVSMAEIALNRDYIKPNVVDQDILEVVDGQHIVLEKYNTNLVKNDCSLGGTNSCMVMTGPNMSGKTTFLKQNAIIVLLSHIGLYVPARSATVGLTDGIFVRVGAHDNLVRGMSTFMIEMHELAQILNKSTKNSLIVIDEIGRGTSVNEGLGIACAVIEHLQERQIRSIFSTHYLNIIKYLDKPYTMQMLVAEDKGEIRFLHKVVAGSAQKSYALSVGKFAGIPVGLLQRAENITHMLCK